MVLALRFVRFLHGMKCFWMLLDFTGKYTNESLDAASMVRILQRHSKSIMLHYGATGNAVHSVPSVPSLTRKNEKKYG